MGILSLQRPLATAAIEHCLVIEVIRNIMVTIFPVSKHVKKRVNAVGFFIDKPPLHNNLVP